MSYPARAEGLGKYKIDFIFSIVIKDLLDVLAYHATSCDLNFSLILGCIVCKIQALCVCVCVCV